jgi:protein TonB
MDIKKNKKHNLEKKRGLFLNIGLVAAGAVTLAAFTYSVPLNEKIDKFESEKKIFKETFELVHTAIDKKSDEQAEPQSPPIFDPERLTEVDKVEPDPITDPFLEIKVQKPDFTIGKLKPGTKDPGDNDPGFRESHEVDFEPQFPGGDNEMAKFIQKNYRIPPIMDVIDQGVVYVRMVVTKDGEITDVEIARGVSTHVDKEAIRVVKLMPKWTPGKYRGRNVNVRMVIPIRIVLG